MSDEMTAADLQRLRAKNGWTVHPGSIARLISEVERLMSENATLRNRNERLRQMVQMGESA